MHARESIAQLCHKLVVFGMCGVGIGVLWHNSTGRVRRADASVLRDDMVTQECGIEHSWTRRTVGTSAAMTSSKKLLPRKRAELEKLANKHGRRRNLPRLNRLCSPCVIQSGALVLKPEGIVHLVSLVTWDLEYPPLLFAGRHVPVGFVICSRTNTGDPRASTFPKEFS